VAVEDHATEDRRNSASSPQASAGELRWQPRYHALLIPGQDLGATAITALDGHID